jgi:xylose isomerase
LSAFFTVDLLDNGTPNGGIAPYQGYRHFDYKPSRTETEVGVWESARANIETYALLSEKAKAYRADPEVKAAFERAGFDDMAQPTLNPGESAQDFVAADEVYDVDAMANRDRGYVHLHQLALKHLIG